MKFRNGLIIFMISFMIFIVTLGILMQRQGSDLVSDEYYAQDRAYQLEMDALKNASKNNIEFRITQDETSLRLSHKSTKVPNAMSLYFMRPNDKRLDQSFEINSKLNPSLSIPKKSFKKGRYQVEIRYKMAGEMCLQRMDLLIK